jgi:hypothetical protein
MPYFNPFPVTAHAVLGKNISTVVGHKHKLAINRTTVVVYETDDSDFADSAIEALTKANIDC